MTQGVSAAALGTSLLLGASLFVLAADRSSSLTWVMAMLGTHLYYIVLPWWQNREVTSMPKNRFWVVEEPFICIFCAFLIIRSSRTVYMLLQIAILSVHYKRHVNKKRIVFQKTHFNLQLKLIWWKLYINLFFFIFLHFSQILSWNESCFSKYPILL